MSGTIEATCPVCGELHQVLAFALKPLGQVDGRPVVTCAVCRRERPGDVARATAAARVAYQDPRQLPPIQSDKDWRKEHPDG